MAIITVNREVEVNGHLSFNRAISEDKKSYEIEGIFSTHLYFEDITELETSRYKLTGVEVHTESFGSDDYDIVYHLRASHIEILGERNKEYETVHCLYEEEQEAIEEIMYKDDHIILGGIGSEYRDIIRDEEGDSNGQPSTGE